MQFNQSLNFVDVLLFTAVEIPNEIATKVDIPYQLNDDEINLSEETNLAIKDVASNNLKNLPCLQDTRCSIKYDVDTVKKRRKRSVEPELLTKVLTVEVASPVEIPPLVNIDQMDENENVNVTVGGENRLIVIICISFFKLYMKYAYNSVCLS